MFSPMTTGIPFGIYLFWSRKYVWPGDRFSVQDIVGGVTASLFVEVHSFGLVPARPSLYLRQHFACSIVSRSCNIFPRVVKLFLVLELLHTISSIVLSFFPWISFLVTSESGWRSGSALAFQLWRPRFESCPVHKWIAFSASA